jgi:pimeloyl-ACP methyl ester carboxylesterase
MPNVDANGISLHYESIGNPSDPTILLVMGLGVQMILWPDAFCAQLANHGFHVVRFDNRDVGLSTHLHQLGVPNIPLEYMKFMMRMPVAAKYSLVDMADDTAGLLDALQIPKAHLVGMSMGGMIAQNFAVRYPQKIATLTSIMSTTGRRSLPQARWRAMKAILSRPAKPNDVDAAVERMLSVLQTIGSQTYPADPAYLREICMRHVLRSNDPRGGARQIAAIAAADDRTSIVRMIKAPTLVIHGDEDPLVPYAAGIETARCIREGGGEAKLSILRGMGHDLPVVLWPQLIEDIVAHARMHPMGER